ncbi:hypothetical protein ACWF94_10260 [Streptomyces sp. NPDC055078]
MTNEPRREASAHVYGHHGTTRLRRLPWDSPEGKACYLSPSSTGSVVSRIADEIEEAQTNAAATVIQGIQAVLDDRNAGVRECRFALTRAQEVLRDLLRVAESRGDRLPTPDSWEPGQDDRHDEGGDRTLPSSAGR